MSNRCTAKDVQKAVEQLGKAMGLGVQPQADWQAVPGDIQAMPDGGGSYRLVRILTTGGAVTWFGQDRLFTARELCQMIYFALNLGVENVHKREMPEKDDYIALDDETSSTVVFGMQTWDEKQGAWLVEDPTGEDFLIRRADYLDYVARKKAGWSPNRRAWKVFHPTKD